MNMERRVTLAGLRWARPTVAALCVFFLAGCGAKDPFAYVKVSGKVMYEDGSLIPFDGIVLMFYPQGSAIDAKTHPRLGRTTIDKTTGEFHEVTSHYLNDGLVRGKHKVALRSSSGQPLPPELVPPEYGDPFKTPLEIDTADRPLELRVKRP